LRLLANLSDHDLACAPPQNTGTLIWGSELTKNPSPPIIAPWTVSWRIG
jgi:hypothetical protein